MLCAEQNRFAQLANQRRQNKYEMMILPPAMMPRQYPPLLTQWEKQQKSAFALKVYCARIVFKGFATIQQCIVLSPNVFPTVLASAI